MQIALIVGDRDRGAGHGRRAQAAPLQLVVAPYLGPVALTQRHHDAVGLGHEQIVIVERQSALARHVVRPPNLTGIEREHGGAALKARGKHIVADARAPTNRYRPDGRVRSCHAARRAPCPTRCRRCSSETAMTLPLSKPLTAISLAITGIAVPRKLKRGTCCSTDQSSLPLRASKPCRRPSTERITTTFSPMAGADSSSELTRVRHSSLPGRSVERDHRALGRADHHHARSPRPVRRTAPN